MILEETNRLYKKDYCLTEAGTKNPIAVGYLNSILLKRLQKNCSHPRDKEEKKSYPPVITYIGTGKYVGEVEIKEKQTQTYVFYTCKICNKRLRDYVHTEH